MTTKDETDRLFVAAECATDRYYDRINSAPNDADRERAFGMRDEADAAWLAVTRVRRGGVVIAVETVAPVTVLGVALEHTGDAYGMRRWSNVGSPLCITANSTGGRWQIAIHANGGIVAHGMASTFEAAHAICEAQWAALCAACATLPARGAL